MPFDHAIERSTLREMLTYARPMGSPIEQAFRDRFLMPLPTASYDEHLNIHVRVGTDPKVLWSCHTDTVHHAAGRQTLTIVNDIASLSTKSRRRMSCLGADDTVGVWLCWALINRSVPGHYIFHYGEERGCVGSKALAKSHPDWLGQFSYAIAFDRAGYSDVITHQMGRRCASDEFARGLAERLNTELASPSGHAPYAPCDGGVYTDTNEYVKLIPECTNLSVGYKRQHSAEEWTDLAFAAHLLEALTTVDISTLPVARDPHAKDTYDDDDYGNVWMRGFGWERNRKLPIAADDESDCVQCGIVYKTNTSDADAADCFCSIEHEEMYWTDDAIVADDLLNHTDLQAERDIDCFLDRTTADVQAALAKDFNLRLAKRRKDDH